MNTSIHDYLLACAYSLFEIIILIETWLDNRTCSKQIFETNYEVFRCDRSALNSCKSTGGGVLIAVHRQFKASILECDEWAPIEQVWVKLKLSDRSVYLCAVYLPPDRVREPSVINAHVASVNKVSSMASAFDDIIILGDFNLPGVNWCERGNGYLFVDASSSTLSPSAIELFDCYSAATVQQINKVSNENGRYLDLCFASVRSQAPELMRAPSPLVKDVFHHPALVVTICQRITNDVMRTPPSVHYDFPRADYTIIKNTLNSIDWEATLDKDDVDAAAFTFSHILNYVIDRHVPKKINCTQKWLPWINATLRRLKSERKAALKRFSRYRTLPLRNHYISINKRYKKLSRCCYRNYMRNVERRLKRNPKSFWKYVSEQRKENGLPSAMFLGGDAANSVEQTCQLFLRKFSNVFVYETLTEEDISAAVVHVPNLGLSMNNFTVDDTTIALAAKKLKSSCSTGPDGVPSIFLKNCSTSACFQLISQLRCFPHYMENGSYVSCT